MVAIITTIRKMITVMCSILLFNHSLASMQWVGIAVVFFGTLLEMREKFGSSSKNGEKKEKQHAKDHQKPKRH